MQADFYPMRIANHRVSGAYARTGDYFHFAINIIGDAINFENSQQLAASMPFHNSKTLIFLIYFQIIN
ncbi:hypothetical protein XNC3_870018 [Xenorhabdus nematophila F1]|nr:hypothetical protein XNC3_870018 [Xenorhabdus nematophila F1]